MYTRNSKLPQLLLSKNILCEVLQIAIPKDCYKIQLHCKRDRHQDLYFRIRRKDSVSTVAVHVCFLTSLIASHCNRTACIGLRIVYQCVDVGYIVFP